MTTLRVAARSLSIRASHDQLLQTRARANGVGGGRAKQAVSACDSNFTFPLVLAFFPRGRPITRGESRAVQQLT